MVIYSEMVTETITIIILETLKLISNMVYQWKSFNKNDKKYTVEKVLESVIQ